MNNNEVTRIEETVDKIYEQCRDAETPAAIIEVYRSKVLPIKDQVAPNDAIAYKLYLIELAHVEAQQKQRGIPSSYELT